MPVIFNPFTGNLDFINDGDITAVTAGASLSGGGTSGNVTLNVAISAANRLLGRYSTGSGNAEEITLGANLQIAGSTLNVLNNTLYINVKNTGGVPLSKGTPVYITGSVGGTNVLEVSASDSSVLAKSPTVGLLVSDLTVNGQGSAVMFGELTGIDTSTYAIGNELFVASGGGLTATKPTSGYVQSVAVVSRVNANTGALLVWVAGRINEALGTSTQVQFNDSGNLAGSSSLTFDKVTGTLRSKYQNLASQASSPTTPLTGFTLFANASNAFSWVGANGFLRVFDGTSNTADRTYTLPNSSGSVALVPGSTTQIAFNDGGALGASSDFTYNKTSKVLTNKGDITLDDGGSFSTTWQLITPTKNNVISFPDSTGTVALIGGSNGQVIYNNAGVNAGVSTFIADSSGNLTLSGRWTSSYSSLASAPANTLSGSWFTGGSATTTKPHFLIEPTGATSTAWSTAGTGLGVNSASSFTGRLLDLQVNGTPRLHVTATGLTVFTQPSPTAVDTSATLTIANIQTGIITSSTAAAVSMTLPTGTLMDGGFASPFNDMAVMWTIINTGATNDVTVAPGSSHTIVGNATIKASSSGRFYSRRTGSTTWVTYRLS